MSTSRIAPFGYSENQMADAFLELLQSPEGLPSIGPFNGVYREVSCHQGRPDFIAIRNKEGGQQVRLSESAGLVGPSILTILKPKAPRTLDYLVTHSEFSQDSIKRALRQFIASGHVEGTQTGSYRLGSAATQPQVELWSFELKLNNPKRAIFQAQQSRAYADRAIIVVPVGQERNYDRYIETMKRWSIGLATFDPISSKFRLLRRGRVSLAFNRQHKIYALSQLLSVSH